MKTESNSSQKEWRYAKLGDVCEIVSGNTPKGLEKISNLGELHFYKVSDMNLVGNEIKMKVSNLKLSDQEIKSLKIKVFPKGTVIFPKRGGAILTNKKRVLSQKASFDLNIMGLLPNETLISDYLFYWMLKLDLSKIYDGSNVPQINNKNVVPLQIPIPTIDTQQTIVSKIEELFSELDKGIENLLTARQQLKTYRQSVLKWAFVNDTFKSYVVKDVTEKIQIGPFGTQLHKEDYVENGIPLINPTHIKDGVIIPDISFTILESKRDSLPSYILYEGDVIMGRRGEMGRCGLVSKKEAGWFCGTGSLYFRPDRRKIDPYFLYYNLRSEPVKKYLENNAGGTTMANLNLKTVKEIPISIPSMEEQHIIVAAIERRLSVADKIQETITTSLQQAAALRQSILKKAFEGKFVIE